MIINDIYKVMRAVLYIGDWIQFVRVAHL